VKDQDGGPWDCTKITETVQQVAGKVSEIPQDPFTIFALICNAAYGKKMQVTLPITGNKTRF
jgi:hypothetical protein